MFEYDFSEFRIGTAENPSGPTGCTVFHFPRGASAAYDVRGGSAAFRDTGNEIDALVFSGGSTYGLAAADGVMRSLLALRANSTRFADIPCVPAAVIYDFAGRENAVFPDAELGARAFSEARKGAVRVGRAGAGVNATVGKYLGRGFAESSGQGAAFFSSGKLRVFAFAVVNAVGNILNEDGTILRGSLDPHTGKRLSIPSNLERRSGEAPQGNTTLSAIITNARLDSAELQRVAMMAHAALGRVIEPFHAPQDGDFLAVISPEGERTSAQAADVGTLAGHVIQQAVWNSIKSQ